MEFLKQQGRYVADQFRTFSASQRIAIALLLVVLLGATYQMLTWAGGPDWQPLLDQSFTPAQIQRVQGELAAVGMSSRVEGDRILIRGNDDERQRLMAMLAQKDALPRDMTPGYAALMKETNAFISTQESKWRQARGLEAEIAAVLRRFQGVRDASVLVQVPENRGFATRAKTSASASVNLVLNEGDVLDKKRIAAIANFVAGAVPGLTVHDVKITDGVQFHRAPDPNSQVPGDMLELQLAAENLHTRKIYDQFSFIPGLVVNVHARLRDADERVNQTVLGDIKVSEETEKNDEMENTAAAVSPGVRPNQGLAIDSSGPASTSVSTEAMTKYNGERDRKQTDSVRLAGFVDKLTASINVPHSYLAAVYRKQKGLAEDAQVAPGDVDAAAQVELKKIRDQVKTLLQAPDEDHVVVSSYFDLPKAAAADLPGGGAGGLGSFEYMALLRQYGPQAGLGLLAFISLLAVMRIAKKAQASVARSRAAMAGAAAHGGAAAILPTLGGGPEAIGEAEGITGAMIGHEVDEGLVRTQQIVDQIAQLVKEDPDSAAGILQTWLADSR